MTKNKKIILLIIILLIFICISICGMKIFFGYQRENIKFSELSTIQQTEIKNSIKVLIGIEPEIEIITYTKYKNGLTNYNIKLNNNNVYSDNLHELNESSSSTNLTGYYYKNDDLYLIIGERDYSKLIGEDNKIYSDEVLKELDSLIETFSEYLNVSY